MMYQQCDGSGFGEPEPFSFIPYLNRFLHLQVPPSHLQKMATAWGMQQHRRCPILTEAIHLIIILFEMIQFIIYFHYVTNSNIDYLW